MHEPFITAKMLIGRARGQLLELSESIDRFKNSANWPHLVEKDVDGVTDIHKCRLPPNPSEEWTHAVFEITNKLRSALDQIAFNVAIIAGKPDAKAAKFPFGPTETDMLNNLKGGCKDLPPEIQTIFREARPFRGANNALWALNELANANKHKLLIPMGMTRIHFEIPDAMNGNPFAKNFFYNDKIKNEMSLLKVAPGGQHLKYDAVITLTIAIEHSDELIRGQDPIYLLDAMDTEVDRIGNATEAECRRLGLLK